MVKIDFGPGSTALAPQGVEVRNSMAPTWQIARKFFLCKPGLARRNDSSDHAGPRDLRFLGSPDWYETAPTGQLVIDGCETSLVPFAHANEYVDSSHVEEEVTV